MDFEIFGSILPFAWPIPVSSSLFSVALGPALAAGFLDGLNPCALTGILIFFIFLILLPHSLKQFFLVGTSFLLARYYTSLLLSLGGFGGVFDQASVVAFLKILNKILAIGFLILGTVNFYDWWVWKRTQDPQSLKLKSIFKLNQMMQAQPITLSSTPSKSWRPSGKVIVSVLGGCGLSLLASVWPEHIYQSVMLVNLFLPGMQFWALLSFFIYYFAYYLFYIVFFLLLYYGMRIGKFRLWLERSMAKIKILESALFYASGAGLFFALR